MSGVTETEMARGTRSSVAECVMPCLPKRVPVLDHERCNSGDLTSPEPAATREPDGIEPKLRGRLIPLNMNMRWFGPFGGLKEQLVRAYIGYGWHAIHLSVSK